MIVLRPAYASVSIHCSMRCMCPVSGSGRGASAPRRWGVWGSFAVNEGRRRNPSFPFSLLRIKGLAAADATQRIAFADFVSTFYFLTLYMQTVLGYSPIKGGSAYLPVTVGIALAAGVRTKLTPRVGARPIIVAGV